MYLYFKLKNILRLSEIMKMICKKCIRIVKGTSNLTSTMFADFVLDAYTDIAMKCVLYKMDMIRIFVSTVLYRELSLHKVPFVYIRF